MNYYNVSRATQGLVAYLQDWRSREKIEGTPKIVIAHDSRFFSKEFAELAAKTAAGKWLRRLCLRRPAVDAGTLFCRAAVAGERGHRDYRQPQPAARQRLQGLFRRRRASGRAARQRNHRQGQLH